MRRYIIKTACVAVSLCGLLLVVADMPGAGALASVAVKAAGLLLFWAGAKTFERLIPEEA
jgi:hypothetical protein